MIDIGHIPPAIGDCLVAIDEEVLKDQTKVEIDWWIEDLLWMHDEPSNATERLLHRHVRVIEEGAFLVYIELINERLARFDWVLS